MSVEVVDPRTLVPLDTATIEASVAKTHRLVVVHEAVQFGGLGAEIAAHVAQHCFWELDAPVARVGAPQHPMPYQKDLELATLPGPAEITAAVRERSLAPRGSAQRRASSAIPQTTIAEPARRQRLTCSWRTTAAKTVAITTLVSRTAATEAADARSSAARTSA